jgi:hypothetical protein
MIAVAKSFRSQARGERVSLHETWRWLLCAMWLVY